MNVVTYRRLKALWERHPDARGPLTAWYADARRASWNAPSDIRARYNIVDFVGDNRVVFNLGGNKYRLIVRVSYTYKQVLVKFVGAHSEYDKINAETV